MKLLFQETEYWWYQIYIGNNNISILEKKSEEEFNDNDCTFMTFIIRKSDDGIHAVNILCDTLC